MAKRKTRKKTGPAAFPPERLRTRILGVKLNAAEYETLVNAAGPYPVATWARAVLIEAAQAGR